MSTFQFWDFKFILIVILLYLSNIWIPDLYLSQSISTLWYFYSYLNKISEYFFHLWTTSLQKSYIICPWIKNIVLSSNQQTSKPALFSLLHLLLQRQWSLSFDLTFWVLRPHFLRVYVLIQAWVNMSCLPWTWGLRALWGQLTVGFKLFERLWFWLNPAHSMLWWMYSATVDIKLQNDTADNDSVWCHVLKSVLKQ